MTDSCFHLFGIRHHGPGCARSLVQALDALQPDCLLVEGPPEGETMLPFVLDAGLTPPVALLIYNPDDSHQAAFYPFAEFSPEWQALGYALSRNTPTRFMDLPMGCQFALDKAHDVERASCPSVNERDSADANVCAEDTTNGQDAHSTSADANVCAEDTTNGQDARSTSADANVCAEDADLYADPLHWLGQAAGYDDGESWWNHLVEERNDSLELFAAIGEAMTTVRSEAPARRRSDYEQQREVLREAHMRKTMRQAQKDGFERIAVVCGAWHVPALEKMPTAKADNDLLKALPKTKVAATWAPWSYHNLSDASGYGAGIAAPAWYEHLWRSGGTQQRAVGWLARAARLFRAEDLDCSSAHIIEAVRLADALAALRAHHQPGLDELCEALRTVVCMGDDAPMQLIHRQLIVGDRLGGIPEQAPAVPLQRDLEQQQKSLRLKPEAAQKNLDLDLRQANDLARSHLLHRLSLLDIAWGDLNKTGKSAKGTFHELWTLQWQPELVLAVITASRWGNTVEAAATAKAVDRAQAAQSLPELSELVNQTLLADLQAAIAPVTQALENLAAVATDIAQLLAAIPPLTHIVRYGNVRNTDVAMVNAVLEGLIPRAAIGLSGACSSLDDDAAQTMREHIAATHKAVRLLANDELSREWHQALQRVAHLGSSHGLICGLAARLLFDDQVENAEQTAIRMSQALSVGNDPGPAAAWLEGFLNRSGMVLLHDDPLWTMVDEWLSSLVEEHFLRVVPLLRRTFATFNAHERRQMGERAQRPAHKTASVQIDADWDAARAEQPIPLLRLLLGLSR
jgi:hypothetical protein